MDLFYAMIEMAFSKRADTPNGRSLQLFARVAITGRRTIPPMIHPQRESHNNARNSTQIAVIEALKVMAGAVAGGAGAFSQKVEAKIGVVPGLVFESEMPVWSGFQWVHPEAIPLEPGEHAVGKFIRANGGGKLVPFHKHTRPSDQDVMITEMYVFRSSGEKPIGSRLIQRGSFDCDVDAGRRVINLFS